MTWATVPIGTVIRSSQYGLSLQADPDGHVPIVGMKDIQDGRVRIDPNVCVNLSEEDAQDYLLADGDILLNRTNSPDLVGKTGIYRGDGKAVFASYLVRLVLDRERVDPDYVIQILASEGGQRHIKQLATRAVSQANLNPTTFKSHFYIPLPRLGEQIAIRGVLLTWDTAIEKTQRLITAKNQRLSHLREHQLTKLNQSTRIKLKSAIRESTARNGKRLGREAIMAVTKQVGLRPMREETIAAAIDRYKVVRPQAFAYNPMRLNIGSIAISSFDDDVLVSPDYVVFECDEAKLLPGYLNHLRRTRHWASHFEAAGSGGVRIRIYYDDLGAFAFPLPSLAEQQRVLSVLDAGVAEIETLEHYLAALQKQKRGLMQKLLTGQWRVPTNKGDSLDE